MRSLQNEREQRMARFLMFLYIGLHFWWETGCPLQAEFGDCTEVRYENGVLPKFALRDFL